MPSVISAGMRLRTMLNAHGATTSFLMLFHGLRHTQHVATPQLASIISLLDVSGSMLAQCNTLYLPYLLAQTILREHYGHVQIVQQQEDLFIFGTLDWHPN
ncbi:MAG: hypothetical protein Q7T01_03980 [bacterium]|nr:hypothetical protein [bacterium]